MPGEPSIPDNVIPDNVIPDNVRRRIAELRAEFRQTVAEESVTMTREQLVEALGHYALKSWDDAFLLRWSGKETRELFEDLQRKEPGDAG